MAFEAPITRGFDTREAALDAAKEHVRTQFARLGLAGEDVEIEIVENPDREEPEL